MVAGPVQFVQQSDIEAVLGRDLTEAEEQRWPTMANAMIEIVEEFLGFRAIYSRQITEERWSPGARADAGPLSGTSAGGGDIRFNYKPVTALISVSNQDYSLTTEDVQFWRTGSTIWLPWSRFPWTITYVAGDDPVAPNIKGVIVETLARSFLVSPQVDLGIITSYSVEGTSISYGPAVTGQQFGYRSGNPQTPVGRFKVADLNAIGGRKTFLIA